MADSWESEHDLGGAMEQAIRRESDGGDGIGSRRS